MIKGCGMVALSNLNILTVVTTSTPLLNVNGTREITYGNCPMTLPAGEYSQT